MEKLPVLVMLFVATISQSFSQQSTFDVVPGTGNGLRFWSSDYYKIHMGNSDEYQFGPVSDYSIKMNMSNTSGRGWTWGIRGATPIAALGIDGRLQISNSFTAGRIIGSAFETKKSSYTKFELAQHDWSGSHAILFNAYKSISANGSLLSTGNTKYANNVGNYTGGAGAMFFNGNGGTMYFCISPASTGADQDVDWGIPKMTIKREGLVGIGTASPKSLLHINSGIEGDGILIIESDTDNAGSEADNARIEMYQDARLVGARIGFNEDIATPNNHFQIDLIYPNGVGDNALTINPNNGKVGLGILANSEDARLVVDGKILAEEIKVQNIPASDYVFEPDYDLKSIGEVESFIKENKHLPGIPSAEEFKENGVGLGEMDDMLLRKVEELTLYVIELKKENETQREQLKIESERNDTLIDKLNNLDAMVKALIDEK